MKKYLSKKNKKNMVYILPFKISIIVDKFITGIIVDLLLCFPISLYSKRVLGQVSV